MRHLLVLFLALSLPTLASASVPSPANSTVPCIVLCPQGDIPLEITVRDLANNPITGSYVQVIFCADRPSMQGSPVGPITFCCDFLCGPAGYTDANGRFVFTLEGGGVSDNVTTCSVRADGVFLAGRIAYSVDQNNDLMVDATDLGIATGLLGTNTPTMDMDCSGGPVDAADVAVVSAHQGHACHCPVPGRRNSWGQIKTLYR